MKQSAVSYEYAVQTAAGDFRKAMDRGDRRGLSVQHVETREEARDMERDVRRDDGQPGRAV